MSPLAAAPEIPASARALIDASLDMPTAREVSAPFLPVLARPDRGVRAVLLYGSRLWDEVRGPGSQPDFIVILDSLEAYTGLVRPLLRYLPPTVYRLQCGGESAKASFVTVSQLRTYCSHSAPDLYFLGRLSKRVALVWQSDPRARSVVVDAQWAALQVLGRLTLARFGAWVPVDDFLRALLALSYESEVRIVERTKVATLFDVEREHYRALGRQLLAHLGLQPHADGLHFVGAPRALASAAELARRLRRSRRRAVLRWPKLMWTYDGWLDYLLAKLARVGASVTLTPAQRRHPFLFATPVLYRLARARKVH